MATVDVRKLGDHVVQRLKQRAAANNRSLESEVRRILEHAAEDNIAAKRRGITYLTILKRLFATRQT